MRLLARFSRNGRNVSDTKGTSYAPALFAQEQEAVAANIRKEAFADAMRRLFAADKIHVEGYGPPSNRHKRLAVGVPK